jgi:glycosyltransferase involved in cell wall biosynthesis
MGLRRSTRFRLLMHILDSCSMQRQMKIAVDGREITRNQPGGFRSYTESVVESVHRYAQDFDLIVYTDREIPADLVQQEDRRIFRSCPPKQMVIREQFSLPRRLSRDRVDLCHFPANTAPLKCPIPYVLTLHDTFCMERKITDIARKGNIHNKGLSLYAKLVPYIAARRARIVLTVSDYSKKQIIKLTGLSEERIAVVPPALHSRYRRVDADHLRKHITSILEVGRLALIIGSAEPRKNIKRMLNAFRRLALQNEDLGLVLIWRSRSGLESWLRTSDVLLPEKTYIVTDPGNSDLVELYSAVNVLMFVSELEGFGLPVIEAMACGCPVVTSKTSSLPDTAGGAALLADPYDENDIARQVEMALFDKATADRMISAGYERASIFNQASIGRSLADIYTMAVGKQHGG